MNRERDSGKAEWSNEEKTERKSGRWFCQPHNSRLPSLVSPASKPAEMRALTFFRESLNFYCQSSVMSIINQRRETLFTKLAPTLRYGVPTRCRRDKFLKRRLPPYAWSCDHGSPTAVVEVVSTIQIKIKIYYGGSQCKHLLRIVLRPWFRYQSLYKIPRHYYPLSNMPVYGWARHSQRSILCRPLVTSLI